jgi:tetratricopeptide (TPR) repeat protein
MITATDKEYDDLTLKSSNLMLQGDSRKALGRYEETAQCYRQAGELRRSMGEAKYQCEDFELAAEDWLSAAACFVEATDAESARDLVLKVRELKAAHQLPAERQDLLTALQVREQEIAQLAKNILQFLNTFDVRGNSKVQTTEDPLAMLLVYRQTLPGFWRLHWAIFHQASVKSNGDLAFYHVLWASLFDPANVNIAAVAGMMQIKLGHPEIALEFGKEFLDADSANAAPVRIMMALAYLQLQPPKILDAMDILRPMINDTDVDPRPRALAICLSAAIFQDSGSREEYRHLLDDLAQMGRQEMSPDVVAVVEEVQKLLCANRQGNGETIHRNIYMDYVFEQSKLLIEQPLLSTGA